MVTVQNRRIRVSVSDDIWEGYRDKAKFIRNQQIQHYGGKREGLSVETEIRGLVLSRGMSIIANKCELQAVRDDASFADDVDPKEVKDWALKYAISHFLCEAGFVGLVPQYPTRAESELICSAVAAAEELISSHEWEDILEKVPGLFHYKRLIQGFNKYKKGSAEHFYFQAAKYVFDVDLDEIPYRERMAYDTGWEIEIIGDLPGQVGTAEISHKYSKILTQPEQGRP